MLKTFIKAMDRNQYITADKCPYPSKHSQVKGKQFSSFNNLKFMLEVPKTTKNKVHWQKECER